jgi:hypothetical protein
LLSLWSEAFGSGDPATLVVYAPGVAPNELEQRLRPLVEQVEGSSGRQLDLVAVAPPSPVDGVVARGVDAVLSSGGLSDVFASLPSAHGQEARHLRAIGERTWRTLEEAA